MPKNLKPIDPDNQESQLTPAEMGVTGPPDQSMTDESKVKLVDDRFTAASDNRRVHEADWYEGLAYYIGNQYVTWSGRSGLVDTRDKAKPWRVYDSRNKIRPKIKKLLASALRNKPDASVVPLTDAPLDRAAASQGRSVLSHMDIMFDRADQTRRLGKWALTTSTVFLKVVWDPTKEADVPIMDPQTGEVSGATIAAVGDIVEDVCPVFEVYLDPQSRTWDEVQWLIHAKVRPLTYIQKRYDKGFQVSPDTSDGPSGYVESRLASVVGEYQRGSEPGNKKDVLVKELWEKPTKTYPEGRLMVVANGILLRDEPWPYKSKELPFVPLSYEEGQGTVYGLNSVTDLKSPQRSYNTSISRIQEHRNTAWGKILVERGANVGADAFDQAKPNEVIYIDRGHTWQHIPAPQLPPVLTEILRIDQGDIEDISGVHEIQEGSPPPNVTAGSAIEMLNESDASQLAEFIGNIETFEKRRAELELSLAAQFYSEPRLVGVQDVYSKPGTESPDTLASATKVTSFEHLSQGSFRVIVYPGSATPKTSAAKAEQLNTMYQMGIFGPPGSPDASALYLKELEYVRADALIEGLQQQKAEMQQLAMANQPNPAQVQQLRNQGQLQQQQMQMAHEQQQQQQQLAMQQQQEQQKQQSDMAHEAQLEAVKMHSAIQLLTTKNQLEIQKMMVDKAHPGVSLSGKLDPKANVEAENAAGFQGDLQGSKDVLTPKPPQNQQSGGATAK